MIDAHKEFFLEVRKTVEYGTGRPSWFTYVRPMLG